MRISENAAVCTQRLTPKALLLLFIAFFLFGTGLIGSSLDYPWFIDDLHLVRLHSAEELRNVWYANWEPRGIETPGYRPLTVWFNHLRAQWLGENVRLQRLLNVGLVALFLVSFFKVFSQVFRLTFRHAFYAGLLALSAQNAWFHLAWITEGVRFFGHLLAVTGIYFLLSAYTHRCRRIRAGLGLFLLSAAPLVREEMLPWYPVAAAALLVTALRKDPQPAAGRFIRAGREIFPAILVLTAAGIFALWAKQTFVPQESRWLDPGGWFFLTYWAVQPAGRIGPRFVRVVYFLAGAIFILKIYKRLTAEERQRLLGCVFLILCRTSPGMISARLTHLMPALTAFALILVFLADGVMRRASVPGRFLVAGILIFLGGLSAFRNRLAQEVMHPLSLSHLALVTEFWCDPDARIPASRRQELNARFESLAIRDCRLSDPALERLRAEAMHANLRHPQSDKTFVPVIDFLNP